MRISYHILRFLYFYSISNYDSHYQPYYYYLHYYCCYYFCHCHYYSFISMLLTFILFYNFVYIKYFWILNIWHSQALFKVGNKATETTLVPLLWILNNVWHKNILALIIISFILHFLIKIYYIAELSVFLFVTWFHIDKA